MFSSPNRLLALVFGVVYLLLGLVGFATTTDGPFFAPSNPTLLLGLLQVNGLHNLAHLALGATLVACGVVSARAAKRANATVGTVLLLLGLAGLFLIDSPANVLAINGADNVLHFGTAIVLLAVAQGGDKTPSG